MVKIVQFLVILQSFAFIIAKNFLQALIPLAIIIILHKLMPTEEAQNQPKNKEELSISNNSNSRSRIYIGLGALFALGVLSLIGEVEPEGQEGSPRVILTIFFLFSILNTIQDIIEVLLWTKVALLVSKRQGGEL